MTDELLSQGVWDLFQHDPLPNLGDQSSLADLSALSFWDVIQELETRLQSCSFPCSVKQDHEQVRHVSVGAHTSRGAHLLRRSWESPWSELLPLVHEPARQRPAVCQHPYLSAAFLVGSSPPHVEANEGLNSVITLGSFQGGELIVNGKAHKTLHRWLTFDPTAEHEVLPYDGWRISIALYTLRDHHLLTSTHWNWLAQLGFPVRWWMEENHWRQQSSALLRTNFPKLEPIPEDELATAIAVDEDNPAQTEELRDAPLPVADEVTLEVPTSSQKSALLRAHCNLGHPQVKYFVRALRLAGIRKGISLWVQKHFHCPACAAWRPKSVRRPAALPRSYELNRVVGCDTVFIHLGICSPEAWLNIVDWGTRFQQAARFNLIGDPPCSEDALQGLLTSWCQVFGFPETVIVDAGSEFKGAFRDYLEERGIYIHVINSRAPWENGITERHGGLLKENWLLRLQSPSPQTR